MTTRRRAHVTIRTPTAGLALVDGCTLAGSATVHAGGRVEGDVSIGPSAAAGPSGRPSLAVAVDSAAAVPARVRLLRDGGADGLPRDVALFPEPDTVALERFVVAIAPAEVLRLVAAFARREVPALGDLFEALGLADSTGRFRVPAALMADPARWFLDAATLGATDGRPDIARLQSLFAAVRGLVPGAHPPDGIQLPWGLQVRATVAAGVLRARLGWGTPESIGALRLSGAVALELSPTGALSPVVDLVVDLTDPGAPGTVLGGIDVGIGATPTVAARIPVGGGAPITVPLLPIAGGLGGLAGAAERALPLALDALTNVGTFAGLDVGAAVATLGDALDLRTGTPAHFDISRLELLAANPVAQLTARLTDLSNRQDLVAALGALTAPLLPGTSTAAGTLLTLAPSPHVEVKLDLSAAIPKVCLRIIDSRPVDGLSLGGELCIGDGGVRKVAARRRRRRS